MKSLQELINLGDPGWPIVQDWIRSARCPVEVLPVTRKQADEALLAIQVSTRSPMGAIVYESGGLLVDDGWLRILGSGHPRLPRSMSAWNLEVGVSTPGKQPPFLLVADDVLGGFFAVDGGGLGIRPGHVAYFAPDTRAWESLNFGYSEFIAWSLSGELAGFCGGYRWKGWEKDVRSLDGARGYSLYPPLGFGGGPISERSRAAVPIAELWHFHQDLGRRLRDLPDGAQIDFKISPPGHS